MCVTVKKAQRCVEICVCLCEEFPMNLRARCTPLQRVTYPHISHIRRCMTRVLVTAVCLSTIKKQLLVLNPSPTPPPLFFSFESFFNKAFIFHVDKNTKLGCNGNSFHRYNYVQINHSVSRQENSRSRSRNSPPTLNPYPLYFFFLSFFSRAINTCSMSPNICFIRITYVCF